jgi:hypothetical protein
MAYTSVNSKGRTDFFHCKKVTSKSGKERDPFFFARDVREEFTVDAVPTGKQAVEMASGLPVLQKV